MALFNPWEERWWAFSLLETMRETKVMAGIDHKWVWQENLVSAIDRELMVVGGGINWLLWWPETRMMITVKTAETLILFTVRWGWSIYNIVNSAVVLTVHKKEEQVLLVTISDIDGLFHPEQKRNKRLLDVFHLNLHNSEENPITPSSYTHSPGNNIATRTCLSHS